MGLSSCSPFHQQKVSEARRAFQGPLSKRKGKEGRGSPLTVISTHSIHMHAHIRMHTAHTHRHTPFDPLSKP